MAGDTRGDDENGAPQDPILSGEIPNAAHAASQRDSPERKWVKWRPWRKRTDAEWVVTAGIYTMVFDGLLVLLTFVFAYYSLEQTRILDVSLDETLIGLEQNRLSNRIAIRSLELDKRAWVLFDKIVETKSPKESEDHITVSVKNFGQGPAFNVKVMLSPGLGTPSAPPLEWDIGTPAVVLGPGQVHKEERTSRKATVVAVPFVTGRILYRDQFGRDRMTLFCLVKMFWEETQTYVWVRGMCRGYEGAS